jgi:hypothetical protein
MEGHLVPPASDFYFVRDFCAVFTCVGNQTPSKTCTISRINFLRNQHGRLGTHLFHSNVHPTARSPEL